MKIALSNLCENVGHCRTCRDREGGGAWRVSLGKVFGLPTGAPDFECPRGKPWGYQGGAPATPAPMAAAHRRDASLVARRERACALAECDHCRVDGTCDRVGGCYSRQMDFYGNPRSRCPLPEPVWGPETDGGDKEIRTPIERASN